MIEYLEFLIFYGVIGINTLGWLVVAVFAALAFWIGNR